jgi:hypothetical protein
MAAHATPLPNRHAFISISPVRALLCASQLLRQFRGVNVRRNPERRRRQMKILRCQPLNIGFW